MEKNKSRDIICCLHKKIRTLKQSLKPLLMAAILGKLLTKNRQFQMLITFEPFIRFLQMKAQKSSYIELYLMVKKRSTYPLFCCIMMCSAVRLVQEEAPAHCSVVS
jgi:hypothetical protein